MKSRILLIVLLFAAMAGYGQKWVDMMNDPTVNFYDVQREANLYFETNSKGKGSGWKQFKRWEYEMQFQIDAKGRRLDGRTFWNAMESVEGLKAVSPVSNWTELGPKSWLRTSGWNPGVGRITCIAVNPADQNEIYVGSPGGGVWKTTNGGSTWSVLTDNLTVLDIYSITIDPVTSTTVYVGSKGGGVLKSTNSGTTWVAATSGIPTSSQVNRILVDPTNTSILLAATSSGIYRSTNAGTSWTQAQTGSFNDLEFKPGNTSIVYGCGNSFYRSSNNGSSFTLITSGISTSGRSFISVTPANANYVYMVQAKGSEFGYLFRSTDSGNNFTTQVTGSPSTGTNYFSYSPNGTDAGGQAWYDMAMCVSPTNADEVYIAGILIWKSTNGGTSFTALTEWFYPNSRGYTHCDMHALEYVGGTLYTGSDGGIYKSTDGGDNYTDLSVGLGIRQFYRLGGSRTVPGRIAGGAQDNGSSILKSGTWIDWLGADGMETMIDHSNADIIYGTSQNGVLYKSTDGGNTRFNLTTPPGSGPWVTQFVMDPKTPSILYVGYNEVFRSTTSGSSWTAISAFGGGAIQAITVAPSDPNYIYASNGSALYVTKNGGSTWTNITTGTSGTIYYIAVHSSNPEKVAVATSGGTGRVFRSTNAGTSWTNISGTLPTLPAKSIVYHDGGEEALYLALTVGVYYRDNTMSDWAPFMTNLPKVQLNELELHQGAGKIRVATYGRGMWESDLPCSSPGAFSVTALTTTSATLNWGTIAGSPTYNVKWRQAGSGTWMGTATVSGTSHNITGLTGGTTYEFSVSTNCSNGTTVDSPPYPFTTVAPCSVPTGLAVSSITSSGATLSWIAQPSALSFDVWWKKVGTSTWIGSANVTTNSYNVTGLTPSTNYEFTVRSNCSSGPTAYASPYKSFTTAYAPLQADLTILNPYFTLPDYLNHVISTDFIATGNIEIDTLPRVVAGEPIDMHCTVKNIGSATATGNYTGFYLSKYSTMSGAPRWLGDYYIYSHPVNTSYYITKRCTIPINATLGIQYLLYNADDYGLISESNETNNLKYIKVYVIGAPEVRRIIIPLPGAEPGSNGPSLPTGFAAVPNPTSGSVNLNFTLGENSPVEISIYDQLGKRVAGVTNTWFEAGTHSLNYDISGAAGIYICRLVTGKNVETVKLIKE